MKDTKTIVVCDLDGTLLRKDKTISEATCEYLINLQQQGIILVLASGRFYHEMEVYMHQLQMPKYRGYLICGNGLELYQGTSLLHSFDRISVSQCLQLLNERKHRPIAMHVQVHKQHYADFGFFFNFVGNVVRKLINWVPIHQFYLDKLRYFTFTNHMDSCLQQPMEKLCFLSTPTRVKRYQKLLDQIYPNQYRFYDLHPCSFELVSNTVGKHLAVAWLCEQIQCAMEDVIAFGDSGNDEALLLQAGRGFVMKNGYDFVKKKVTSQTEYTNQEDGVMRMLKTIL